MSSLAPGDRPARLSVGTIGAGRVGAVLAAALGRAGHRVVAVSAVSRASLRRADTLVPQASVLAPPEVAARADLLLLAVPDDVLPELTAGLAATEAVRPGTLVAHTCGAHGFRVLDPLAARGALPMALHPVMTFTGTDVDIERLAGACFGVTSPPELRPAAEALVIEMGAEPVWIEEHLRPLYHAALATGANHLVTLVNQAAELLTQVGVDNPPRMLAPLLGAALDNALRHGDGALTGPVARGDAGTVRDHLAVLDAPAVRAAYVAMSRLAAVRALAAGSLSPERAEALLDVLAADEGSP
ncbi:MAG: hypothetical protein QOJ03_1258 [Frankiaceae bacterium]|jgi:predicted short-subunit dehydrogenase-like oxidoreductase (DUF2520 family)|nr:hypothetical protein [Frankiaceae bacterium]